jgi:hypothetical protein
MYLYHLHLKSFSLTCAATKHNSDPSNYCTASYNQEHQNEVAGDLSALQYTLQIWQQPQIPSSLPSPTLQFCCLFNWISSQLQNRSNIISFFFRLVLTGGAERVNQSKSDHVTSTERSITCPQIFVENAQTLTRLKPIVWDYMTIKELREKSASWWKETCGILDLRQIRVFL